MEKITEVYVIFKKWGLSIKLSENSERFELFKIWNYERCV